MSQYRDELEAARHRIETLEAKLREREASLEAREAEIAEQRAEIERARRNQARPDEKRPASISGARLVAIVAAGAFAAFVAIGVAVAVISLRAQAINTTDIEEIPPPPAPPVQVKADPPKLYEPSMPLPSAVSEPSNLATLREAFNKSQPEVRKCYEKELATRPKASGTIRVTIAVGEKGGVKSVTLGESPVRSPTLDACLIKIFKGLQIPELEGGATTVTYPLTFNVPLKDPFDTRF